MIMPQVKTVRLDADGVGLFFGPLEATIMYAMWDGATTTTQVYNYVLRNYTSKQSNNTPVVRLSSVTTVLKRLVQAGYLTCAISRNKRIPNVYTVTIDEDTFVKNAITATLQTLVRNYREVTAKAFVDVVRNTKHHDNT